MKYKAGDVVKVGPAYQGSGRYAADGCEGVYTVLRPLLGGPDYYLVKGRLSESQVSKAGWDTICHESRLTKA